MHQIVALVATSVARSRGYSTTSMHRNRCARTLRSALERAAWCSNDPLCMESEASGADNSGNLAACRACLLPPETNCETNNVFLDRALLIDTPTSPAPGYFTVGE